MQKTKLSDILDEMNVYKDISIMEDRDKVIQLNNSIKKTRRSTVFPWTIRKTSLRVFDGIKEYPVADDHDEILYIDRQAQEVNSGIYATTARFYNTSLIQFYEDVNSSRNLMAEIWKDGTKMIGVNYKDKGLTTISLDNASVVGNYTGEDDVTSVTLDEVVFKSGSSSIRVNITNDSGIATIKDSYTNSVADANYKTKYHFREIFLSSVPTSIEMKLKTDDTNYLSTVVTTQFSGEALKANDWNIIAHDLNQATETGTFNQNSIASEEIILNGAETGTYYLGKSTLKLWTLMDYWYYSFNLVLSSGSSIPDRQLFSVDVIDDTEYLLGDIEWLGKIKYDALNRLFTEVENPGKKAVMLAEKKEAEDAFSAKYPDMVPLISTQTQRYNNDPIFTNGGNNQSTWY